jgi:hypothetical protein
MVELSRRIYRSHRYQTSFTHEHYNAPEIQVETLFGKMTDADYRILSNPSFSRIDMSLSQRTKGLVYKALRAEGGDQNQVQYVGLLPLSPKPSHAS